MASDEETEQPISEGAGVDSGAAPVTAAAATEPERERIVTASGAVIMQIKTPAK